VHIKKCDAVYSQALVDFTLTVTVRFTVTLPFTCLFRVIFYHNFKFHRYIERLPCLTFTLTFNFKVPYQLDFFVSN